VGRGRNREKPGEKGRVGGGILYPNIQPKENQYERLVSKEEGKAGNCFSFLGGTPEGRPLLKGKELM